MVSALRAGGMAVYAVEFPGHDLGEDGEAFAPLEQVVDRVVGEIIRLGRKRFFLWGHSSGAAFALATAKKLDTRSVKVERVFIGAQLLGDADDRRATVTELSRRSNREIAAWLSREGGYTDLGQLDRQPAQHIGAGYRHDCLTANRYFYYVLKTPSAAKLGAPISVVVAADDPHTAGYPQRYRDWERLSEHVDLCELADGGHYFPRTRPAEAAHAVLAAAAALRSS
jgi:surfactin synthase thioesterase subunit